MFKQFGYNKAVLMCVILFASVLVAYLPVRNYQFVKYDDDTYITNNHRVRYGLTRQSVQWAFSSGYASNWHPLTWLSHMLDCQLFGLGAGEHHLVNVLFHIVNTILLFLVLKWMTNAMWASGFVAAVFALHPLHVESVAWVAERKDVLSAFFWILTMWAYAGYVKRPRAFRYAVAVFLFALGLMAKPMLVTLPFVLLLLDYWPLERLRKDRAGRLILEKVPFFVLSAVSSVVTFLAQRSGGAMPDMETIGLASRLANAVSRLHW